jgi:hypothetical protein
VVYKISSFCNWRAGCQASDAFFYAVTVVLAFPLFYSELSFLLVYLKITSAAAVIIILLVAFFVISVMVAIIVIIVIIDLLLMQGFFGALV